MIYIVVYNLLKSIRTIVKTSYTKLNKILIILDKESDNKIIIYFVVAEPSKYIWSFLFYLFLSKFLNQNYKIF